MRTDDELATDIRAELTWDPKIKFPAEISVDARDGVVTLRGTVGGFHQKRAAETAAKRVHGTIAVENELQPRLMDEPAREDAEVRGAALQALTWNAEVPADRVDVAVDLGHLTLTGIVDWRYEKDAAETAVSLLPGVIGVRNEIEVEAPALEADGVSTGISDALLRSAQVHADDIRISVLDGNVTLAGDVRSWAEHDAAVAAASSAPGVREVNDRLSVRL
jgi:osmotically-inducible protein OsmY